MQWRVEQKKFGYYCIDSFVGQSSINPFVTPRVPFDKFKGKSRSLHGNCFLEPLRYNYLINYLVLRSYCDYLPMRRDRYSAQKFHELQRRKRKRKRFTVCERSGKSACVRRRLRSQGESVGKLKSQVTPRVGIVSHYYYVHKYRAPIIGYNITCSYAHCAQVATAKGVLLSERDCNK